MLRDSVVVAVAVLRTRPRAIPLAMITMRKSTQGFPLLSYMSMGLGRWSSAINCRRLSAGRVVGHRPKRGMKKLHRLINSVLIRLFLIDGHPTLFAHSS